MKRVLWIKDINPEPWTAPNVSIGRSGSRIFPRVHKSARLDNYQQGIAESIKAAYPDIAMERPDSTLVVQFFFWRQLEGYTTATGRSSRRHVADATNCSKALEDALQGILYKNDSQIAAPLPVMVEQQATTKPLIIIVVGRWTGAPISMSDHWALKSWAYDKWSGPAVPGNVMYGEFLHGSEL
jgi:Holliday junction resolvase RusA-like endonuclease